MRKKWLLILPVLLLAVIITVLALRLLGDGSDPENHFTVPEHILICLDAGHGGHDVGAVNGDRYEKDDNLRMALAVQETLERAGFDNLSVILTRTDDTFLELEERVQIANDADATLFLSFHRNSGGGQGVETWISAEGQWPETALATYIQNGLGEAGVTRDRGVKKGTASNPHASYYVVGNTEMPACLLELGFIDSDEDNAAFDTYFDAWAEAIADGILQMVALR